MAIKIIGRGWTVLMWLRVGTCGGLLKTVINIFESQKLLGI
jgi:hypothetical protein